MRFCPYPSLIRKMRTYLLLVGQLGPRHRSQMQTQPQMQVQFMTNTPPQNFNTKTKKEKRKIKVPARRKYNVRLIAQQVKAASTSTETLTVPIPTVAITAMPAAPTPTVATIATQTMPMISVMETIPITMHSIAKKKFETTPTEKSLLDLNPSIPPPVEDVPNVPVFKVREDTPWPNTEPIDTNLFEARADWAIPPFDLYDFL